MQKVQKKTCEKKVSFASRDLGTVAKNHEKTHFLAKISFFYEE